jgi:phosphopantothenoylcysteine decarboxylase/phosphopantothenate--cysteine ligase
MLANGDTGDGRMPDETVLLEYILHEIAFEKDMTGKKVLVTAGATQESIDPVRFITNHSTGKMGIALAKAACMRGADVTLVAGHIETTPPMFVNVVNVESAEDMFNAVTSLSGEQDIIIKAAAVSDYTPFTKFDSKIKKFGSDMKIELKRTQDILKFLGSHKPDGQFLCGFSMETDNVIENSTAKLKSKNCDMICANSLRTEGAGFGGDTNIVTIITPDGVNELPKMSKDETAHKILDNILANLRSK